MTGKLEELYGQEESASFYDQKKEHPSDPFGGGVSPDATAWEGITQRGANIGRSVAQGISLLGEGALNLLPRASEDSVLGQLQRGAGSEVWNQKGETNLTDVIHDAPLHVARLGVSKTAYPEGQKYLTKAINRSENGGKPDDVSLAPMADENGVVKSEWWKGSDGESAVKPVAKQDESSVIQQDQKTNPREQKKLDDYEKIMRRRLNRAGVTVPEGADYGAIEKLDSTRSSAMRDVRKTLGVKTTGEFYRTLRDRQEAGGENAIDWSKPEEAKAKLSDHAVRFKLAEERERLDGLKVRVPSGDKGDRGSRGFQRQVAVMTLENMYQNEELSAKEVADSMKSSSGMLREVDNIQREKALKKQRLDMAYRESAIVANLAAARGRDVGSDQKEMLSKGQKQWSSLSDSARSDVAKLNKLKNLSKKSSRDMKAIGLLEQRLTSSLGDYNSMIYYLSENPDMLESK